MDITKQDKLTKPEWESIERPVPEDEQEILNLISVGYNDVDQRHNHNQSLFSFAKMEKTATIENYLYTKFFKPDIEIIVGIIRGIPNAPASLTAFAVEEINIKRLKSADVIRLENMNTNIEINKDNMIEYVYIRFLNEMFQLFSRKNTSYAYYLYTLIQLRNNNIPHKNSFVMDFIDKCVAFVNSQTELGSIISNACDFIEKNPNLFKYGDITLYDHQKRLFSLFKQTHQKYKDNRERQSNLVLYIAPTGTGKTLSPIGLTTDFRVIFVCAARHVGMALAKSAISTKKCVAFAFGCETASDIRLHYLAASVYKINKRSGGIGKVDNSVGNKVEIMICDAKSYLIAMYYMLSFNDATRIITYWDEPTIGMDYTEHPLHEIIHRNWSENKIPNMVLSSATLPKYGQLSPVITDFRTKFSDSVITTIESHDCNKSISLLNKNGFCVCPHLLFPEYRAVLECVAYCKTNMTLLRYFDLGEVVRFICHLEGAGLIPVSADKYFDKNISKIKMNSLKIYYLEVIENIDIEKWPEIYEYMSVSLKRKFDQSHSIIRKTHSMGSTAVSKMDGKRLSRTITDAEPTYVEKAKAASLTSGGILLTTADAHTLTDGPTIYLTENIKTIGNFYIQQSSIPKKVFDIIIDKIEKNNNILAQVVKLEAALEDVLGAEIKKEKKMSSEEISCPEARKINQKIDDLKTNIRPVSLDPVYIPNTIFHQQIWNSLSITDSAFVPNIDQDTVKQIMELTIDDRLKVLLLLGIGSFEVQENTAYTEIVKRLAYNKQLLIIIASSDYIYGTNYQFCHEIIGKDLTNMSQQKTIQALGRVGRNNIQQEYTARFRDDSIILNLFRHQDRNIEAEMMCQLLKTDFDE